MGTFRGGEIDPARELGATRFSICIELRCVVSMTETEYAAK